MAAPVRGSTGSSFSYALILTRVVLGGSFVGEAFKKTFCTAPLLWRVPKSNSSSALISSTITSDLMP